MNSKCYSNFKYSGTCLNEAPTGLEQSASFKQGLHLHRYVQVSKNVKENAKIIVIAIKLLAYCVDCAKTKHSSQKFDT